MASVLVIKIEIQIIYNKLCERESLIWVYMFRFMLACVTMSATRSTHSWVAFQSPASMASRMAGKKASS